MWTPFPISASSYELKHCIYFFDIEERFIQVLKLILFNTVYFVVSFGKLGSETDLRSISGTPVPNMWFAAQLIIAILLLSYKIRIRIHARFVLLDWTNYWNCALLLDTDPISVRTRRRTISIHFTLNIEIIKIITLQALNL